MLYVDPEYVTTLILAVDIVSVRVPVPVADVASDENVACNGFVKFTPFLYLQM